MLQNKLTLIAMLCYTGIFSNLFAQGPYYNSVDLNLTGLSLKDELASHVISTHNTFLSYSQVWTVLMQSDLNPENSEDVLLIYGYSDNDGNVITDRTRDKDFNGGNVGDWNREHVYPRSLGNPNLGSSGSDAHHLRSSDVQMNGSRSNFKFDDGNGNAGTTNDGWFPGEEWKGDCARMMMYMYLRYGSRCLPNNVGIGSTNSIDNNMVDLFLEWNAEDPVSAYELVRNDVVEDAQGNRNPFIDNPALATIIWGGPIAEDPWNLLGNQITLNLKLFLEGPYDPANLDMKDGLRTNNELPMNEPYSASGYTVPSETAGPGSFDVTGNNAIVDWVLVEIRDQNDPTNILGSRVGLLQRDGDIIPANGNSFTMSQPAGANQVYIAVRHRNHFGIRTNTTYSTSGLISIDFSNPSLNVFGSNALKTIAGVNVLIAADANSDGAVNSIDNNGFWRVENGSTFDYSSSKADYNLDGVINTIDRNLYWRVNNSMVEALD